MANSHHFSEQQIADLLCQNYQLMGELTALPGYCDQNFILTTAEKKQYIVKIAHHQETNDSLAMQNAAMKHLYAKGSLVPDVINNHQGESITEIKVPEQQNYYLRVLSYLHGHFLAHCNNQHISEHLWHNFGCFLGDIDQKLADFTHPGAYRYLEWDLAQGYQVCMSKKQLLNAQQLVLVDKFLLLYQTQTAPVLAQLPTGVIHNDANDHNVLVNNLDAPDKIAGLIDFGDMVYSQVINELAIACAYALMHSTDILKTLKTIVGGYHQVKPLSDSEIDVLFSLVALRLCTTVCNAALAITKEPDNEYLSISVEPAWRVLNQFDKLNVFSVQCQLKQICQKPVDNGQSKRDIIDFRQKHLGKTLSLAYQQPLKIIRGQGAYLYDEQGTPYLDMVNNVCHVGHCHPKVVAAGQQQMALLNTNTRYLHDNIVQYSKKLLATMPEKLSVCMFVNSGSEANELAFRLAKNYTSSNNLLTVDGAYHGNTNACIEASPYKFDGPGGQGAAKHVHKVTLPDPYRGKYQGDNTATQYAEDVNEVINNIQCKSEKVGAFICESIQGVAGQIIMPPGYLHAVYQSVRDAGGVCIADEVQVGFGRVGHHMWAFETQDVVPDIVTLGKPIGNGHPMAAVITTEEIANAFVNGMEYFNTFGGNPVSCAIGMAVLDVIEQEQLQQNALTVGNYLLDQLQNLQQRYPIIGDVRGIGLFIGIELVNDRLTKEPATHITAQLVEFAKAHHILLSTEGRYYNILKIKPPLVFNRDDADKFLTVLELGLQQL
ncbi:aminotransferase [Thalassotalea insulae]|uniref:Aminotransferase n=1 Tax=Thalassotalea insulae TaxID=2056778 RepID=A0ABQ6H0Z4_9GAMM|nr:aminotransferase class III-fold pyridoxal phosphate-dependent enzyme [Thalassotalea insulae]GLX80425.1 aminotransferase [Thalassotalea insulae]